jgi:hypothetical protein
VANRLDECACITALSRALPGKKLHEDILSQRPSRRLSILQSNAKVMAAIFRFFATIRLRSPTTGRPSARRAMSTRTYSDAVEHLNTLQSNAATIEAARISGGRLSTTAIPEMLEYLGRIGYSVRAWMPAIILAYSSLHHYSARGLEQTQCHPCDRHQG